MVQGDAAVADFKHRASVQFRVSEKAASLPDTMLTA
jgi:hypothetical protein